MLISSYSNLCCDSCAKFLHKIEYKYSKEDSPDQTIPEANARQINCAGTSLSHNQQSMNSAHLRRYQLQDQLLQGELNLIFY